MANGFKFRVYYGFVTAGYATLQVDTDNGKEVYHIKGEETMGFLDCFSRRRLPIVHIDMTRTSLLIYPKIDEGGYS